MRIVAGMPTAPGSPVGVALATAVAACITTPFGMVVDWIVANVVGPFCAAVHGLHMPLVLPIWMTIRFALTAIWCGWRVVGDGMRAELGGDGSWYENDSGFAA